MDKEEGGAAKINLWKRVPLYYNFNSGKRCGWERKDKKGITSGGACQCLREGVISQNNKGKKDIARLRC